APCKVVVDYSNPNTGAFSNGAAFRNLARVENYLIRSALARNQQAEAVERATALAKFANQVAREGATIDYLVAQAIRNVALEPLHQNIQRLNNRAALEQLLKWAREDERHRPALDQILETEHHYTRAMTLRVYQSYGQHTDPTNLEWWERMPVLPQVFVKSAIPEMERAWKQIKVYAAKPAHERRASDFPKVRHPYNEIVIPVFKEVIDREAAPAAKARLLGCVAAIRLHKQRTGRYPASLEALRLGELIVDPFSGKPFVYRVDPRRGFMIYSVGADKVDDGGVVEPRDLYGEQGDLAPHSPQNARRTDLWLR
ncbi:MAG: hypothetical protein NZ874_08400, partial [Fimbriimonadales bacterium]|nr:hypothetical protein [Fimbriimonadales bacterium]